MEHIMQRFERLSELFVSCFKWDESKVVEENKWDSLWLFVSCYAFERQGRSPNYLPAAADAIKELSDEKLCAKAAKKVWMRFEEKLEYTGLNHANNPLCPKGTSYHRKDRADLLIKESVSAVEVAAELPKPIVKWARDKIEEDNTKEAHEKLCEIGGIGEKIASLFLRDVTVKYEIIPQSNRHLLQPIDTWAEFVTKKLSGNYKMNQADCANFIVNNSKEPERASQGLWYFCVPVAESSRYVVERCLKYDKTFEEIVEQHLESLRACGKAASEFRNGI